MCDLHKYWTQLDHLITSVLGVKLQSQVWLISRKYFKIFSLSSFCLSRFLVREKVKMDFCQWIYHKSLIFYFLFHFKPLSIYYEKNLSTRMCADFTACILCFIRFGGNGPKPKSNGQSNWRRNRLPYAGRYCISKR